jgi:hypothetical protein
MLIINRLLVQGIQFMHERNVAHRYPPLHLLEVVSSLTAY